MKYKERKSPRLKNYDYSSAGAYFITICSLKRKAIFSKIIDGQIELLPVGKIIVKQIQIVKNSFEGIKVSSYVIMPNHIHLIIEILETGGSSPAPTLSFVVGKIKTLATKSVKNELGFNVIFQRSFYDHVIRNEIDYLTKSKYIIENPIKWSLDELFCE